MKIMKKMMKKIMKKMKIKIKVHTNSSQEKILQLNKDSFEIWIKQKPIENKANFHLEKLLKDYFKREVKIISGLTFKKKIVEIF